MRLLDDSMSNLSLGQLHEAVAALSDHVVACQVGDWMPGYYVGKGFKAQVYSARNVITGEEEIVKIGTTEAVSEREVSVMNALPIHPSLPQLRYYEARDNERKLVITCFAPSNIGQIVEKDSTLAMLSDTPTFSGKTAQKKLGVLFQLLEGIDVLHRSGITHGDIHEGNIAFVGASSQQLVILDYGEAQERQIALWDDETGSRLEKLGDWKLAAKDVRRCGWLALWLWGYSTQCYNPTLNPEAIRVDGKLLREFEKNSAENLIYNLARKNPNDQPTAGEALRHPCFKGIAPLPSQAAEQSVPKSHRRLNLPFRLRSQQCHKWTTRSTGFEGDTTNWVGLLAEYRAANPNHEGVMYQERSLSGGFTCTVSIAESPTALGDPVLTFPRKKEAKKAAARVAIAFLRSNNFMSLDCVSVRKPERASPAS